MDLIVHCSGETDVEEDILSTSFSAHPANVYDIGEIECGDAFNALQRAIQHTWLFWGDTYKYHETGMCVNNYAKVNNERPLEYYLIKSPYFILFIRHYDIEYGEPEIEEDGRYSNLYLSAFSELVSPYPKVEYGRRAIFA